MALILDRYPITYRAEVVDKLMTAIEQGESVCLVGLAGVGKSNLRTFICEREVLHHYLHNLADRTHLLPIEGGSGTQSVEQIYQRMLERSEHLAAQLNLLSGQSLASSPYARLQSLLDRLCHRHNRRIVFLFDEFENLLRNQSPHFLADLRALRDDHRTTRNLLFVVITHRMPQVIEQDPPIHESKFFEIVRNHIFPIPPYQKKDTDGMIDELLRRRGASINVLDDSQRQILYHFSGGHSGLLAAIFDAIYPDFGQLGRRIVETAPRSTAVREECAKIWRHLHREEQEALQMLAQERNVSMEMLSFLQRRGLVQMHSAPEIFSPLFREHVANQQ